MLRLLGWLVVIWLTVLGLLLAGATVALGWGRRDRNSLPRGR